jgi:2-polyprenyl-3-methyl-5-hydroxy-6-metoxy-1,4-benzoquinol methylase
MFWTRRKRSSVPALAASSFHPLNEFQQIFELAGSVVLDRCPICAGGEIGHLWQLPQSHLKAPTYLNAPGSPFHDFYLDHLPLLTVPQRIFVFDVCRFCHSVFRNPKDDDHASYVNDRSKVAAFKAKGTNPFSGIVTTCEKEWPADTRYVVDAACGAGQALALLRERHPGLRLLGLDLSIPSVRYMKSLGLEAQAVDLDLDDLDAKVAPGTADFVLFYEAFEHVRYPLIVLKKLLRLLRRGGRLHFTAQYYGPESTLPVRVGEPIYINRHGLNWIVSQLDAEIYAVAVNTKFRVTLQKR